MNSHSFNVHAQLSSEAITQIFVLSLHHLSLFICTTNDDYGETLWASILVRDFAARLPFLRAVSNYMSLLRKDQYIAFGDYIVFILQTNGH